MIISTRLLTLMIIISLPFISTAQQEVRIQSGEVTLAGTLLNSSGQKDHAVLIIAGSGPTDRDGNSALGFTNNSLKLLAIALDDLGYASLRYDKRGVGGSTLEVDQVQAVRFDDFVTDAVACIRYLKDRYNHVTVLGHSLGALVGMRAAQAVAVDRFISLAGMSEDMASTLERQLGNQPPQVLEAAMPILERLRNGEKVDSVPLFLYSVFAPQLQDYMISVMAYDPQQEIAKLHIPVLCIQGNTDLQITVEGQQDLAAEAKYGTFVEIDSMNHVLKKVARAPATNIASYRDSLMPIHERLTPVIDSFLSEEPWYEKFYYLLGRWQGQGSNSYETWIFDKARQVFKGVSFTEKDGKRKIKENLEIRLEGEHIIYFAQVLDHNEGEVVPFVFYDAGPVYSFLNAGHDFPNTITYTPLTQEEVLITVKGKQGKAIEMRYQRL